MSESPDDEADDADEQEESTGNDFDEEVEEIEEVEEVEEIEEPLSELEGPRASPDDVPADDDVFEEIEVEPMDDGVLWEDLLGDPGAGIEDFEGEIPDGEERVTVVPKRTYCETCKYFSAPPEASCNHPGTEIRELVDMEHFRVVNCPVVASRRGFDTEEPEPADPRETRPQDR